MGHRAIGRQGDTPEYLAVVDVILHGDHAVAARYERGYRKQHGLPQALWFTASIMPTLLEPQVNFPSVAEDGERAILEAVLPG
jgi:hypothetical protein